MATDFSALHSSHPLLKAQAQYQTGSFLFIFLAPLPSPSRNNYILLVALMYVCDLHEVLSKDAVVGFLLLPVEGGDGRERH